jgi:RecB family endonuclease NucS
MKVSFGQGGSARVPWISFTAPGMTVSNGYYPVYLFYKEENVLILSYGISETSEYSESWPTHITETKTRIKDFIDNPPRYGASYVFQSYEPAAKDKVVKFSRDKEVLSSEVLEKELKEIIDFYKKHLDMEVQSEDSVVSSGLFYMEKQLEDFIIENWDKTELGQKYDLITEPGEHESQQYPTTIGNIDILAKDKETGCYVVIELKKNRTSDDVVGQVHRYMGWIKENKGDDNVKSIIVAGKYDEKLYYAAKAAQNVEVFVYEVNFKLKKHEKA